jgi:predicted Fe-Mo cluster-binding NifX family protein
MPVRIAITTSDGDYIDQHFGRATRFLLVDLDREGYRAVRWEQALPAPRGEGHGETLGKNVALLQDAKILLTAKIGPRAAREAERKGLSVMETSDSVEAFLAGLLQSAYFVRTYL